MIQAIETIRLINNISSILGFITRNRQNILMLKNCLDTCRQFLKRNQTKAVSYITDQLVVFFSFVSKAIKIH